MRVRLLIGSGNYYDMAAALELFRDLASDLPVSSHLYSVREDQNNFSIECDHTRLPEVTKLALEALPDTCKNDLR